MRVMEIMLVCSMLVVFGAILWGAARGRAADERLEDHLMDICKRANLNSSYINRLNEATKAGLRPIVIPDCAAILK